MTKILMISDTHTKERQIPGMQEADILLHAGDITFRGEYDRLKEFDIWLAGLDDKFPGSFVDKVVIPGNHDLTFENNWESAASCITEAEVLNQQVYELHNGMAVYGEPRQPEFGGWAFNVSRPDMKEVWSKVPTSIDILLTHGPPAGIGDRNKKGYSCGCDYQREWIEKYQPALVVCGHIHEGYGIYMCGRTVIVNASICDYLYKPENRPIVINV